jgi:lipopolysaccharide transport system ATP-binding protein
MSGGGVVIAAEQLSKRYRLDPVRAQAARLDTLRDRLAALPARIARRRPGERDRVDFWALRDVSFEVRRGEVLGVIGRNGAGKSTLLKVLARITEPTQGRVRLRGEVASLLEVGTGFHAELTGRENIFLNGAILGMSRAEIRARFDEIVAFAEVEPFLETPVKRYSSGMYVRLAFAVAAHLNPDILLVDEVLAVGDLRFQRKCLGKMGEVARHEGRTVLFVSHNIAAVQNLCTGALLLRAGVVEATGGVDEVLRLYLRQLEEQGRAPGAVLASSPSGALDLVAVEAVDDKDGLATPLAGRPCRIRLRIRVRDGVRTLAASIGINDDYDRRVALLHSTFVACAFATGPGAYSIEVLVPSLTLLPGRYSLDVKLITGQEALLWAPRIAHLDVEPADFFGTGRFPDRASGGVCLLPQEWSIEEAP